MGEKVNSNIKIFIGQSLSIDDYNVLTTLYMPIIGYKAYSLYMFCYSILDRRSNMKEIELSAVLKILSMQKNTFDEARKNLEAIGLMNTYEKDQEKVFLLKSPISAKRFMSDALLNVCLYNKVGEATYNKLLDSFKLEIFNKDGYTNITDTFKNVYGARIDKLLEKQDGYFIDKIDNKSVKMEDFAFDFDAFLKMTGISFYDDSIVTPVFQKQIEEIAFYYDLNEEEMAKIYHNSLNDKGDFSFISLNDEVKKERNRKILKDHEDLVTYERMRYLSPEIILRIFCPKAITKDVNIVKKVFMVSPLTEEVNKMVIVHAILKYNKNNVTNDNTICPDMGYFQKTIETFEKFNINDFETAVRFVVDQSHNQGVVKQQPKKDDRDEFEEDEWLKGFYERNR